jgi:hypothetical protein
MMATKQSANATSETIESGIGVDEETLQRVDSASAHKTGRDVIVMLDGRPFGLARDVATRLAWDLCSQLQQ